jgi:hypothetical protein
MTLVQDAAVELVATRASPAAGVPLRTIEPWSRPVVVEILPPDPDPVVSPVRVMVGNPPEAKDTDEAEVARPLASKVTSGMVVVEPYVPAVTPEVARVDAWDPLPGPAVTSPVSCVIPVLDGVCQSAAVEEVAVRT